MALKDKLEQINKLKLELDALQPISVENENKFWKKIRLDWNYNSNHIEGNTLTYGETQLLLMFDKTVGDHELREYEEMKAHDVAIHMVKEWAKDKDRYLNENDIRELNKIILVKPYWKEAITVDGQQTRRQIKVGEYKEYPNSVRQKNGEIFEYTSPLETPQKMAELIESYRKNTIKDAIVTASQLHYSFIRIHPFDDGNGRVARLLVNYVLMKNNYPPIIIKSNEKEKYLTALNKADVGDIPAFHEYMAEQLIYSLELAVKAAKGESVEDSDDIEKELKQIEIIIKNNKANVIKKEQRLLEEICLKSLLPLAETIFNKMQKFNNLFTDFEIVVWDNNTGKTVKTFEDFNKKLKEITLKVNIYKIKIDFSWMGFLAEGADAFGERSEINFAFADFYYYINRKEHQSNILKEYKKLYSEQLTQKEILEIADEMAKNLLNNIKDHYKRITGKDLIV